MPQIWVNGAWQNASGANVSKFLSSDGDYLESVYIQSTAPGSPLRGTFWFDTTILVLKIWNGTSWIIAGSTGEDIDAFFCMGA